MTATAEPASVPGRGFSVTMTNSDELRVALRVEGMVTVHTCPLLLGIVGRHLASGRRHLRLDLTYARIAPGALPCLLRAHHEVEAADGMLLFERAATALADELTEAGLLVVRDT